MGRKKSELHTYGPSLQHTIERGDVFRRARDGSVRIMVVVGKIYHEDLSVSYVFDVSGGRKRQATLHENTFARWGSGGYMRIYKTKRKAGTWSSEKPTASKV